MVTGAQKQKNSGHSRGRPKVELSELASTPLFRLGEAIKLGFSQPTIARAVARGELVHLEHDLYRHPESKLAPRIEEYAVACAHFGPDAVIAGLTALFHYALTDQAPRQIWLMVPANKRTRNSRYRLLRAQIINDKGVTNESCFRITNIERTLAEALRYSTKIGLETALRANRQAFRDGRTTPQKVLQMARELGIETTVLRHWEAINVE